ncbi:MAG: ATP-binding protein [Bacteroidota bacterium]
MPDVKPVLLVVGAESAYQQSVRGMVPAAYHVVEATTLEAAGDAVLHHEPNIAVVVCDGLNPASLLRRLRVMAAREPLAILAVMPSGTTRQVVDAVHAGADDVLIAPDAATLHEALAHTLAGRTAEAQRRADRQLRRREAEANLQKATQRIARWEWNLATGAQTWAASTYALLDYDAATTTPSFEALLARIHPDDRARVQRAMEHMIQDEVPRSLEYRLRYPNGREAHVYADGELVRDSQGRVEQLFGLIIDMTERNLSHQHLEKYAAQAGLLQEFSRVLQEHERDLQGVLDAIVREVAGRLGYTCVILLKEKDHRLNAVAYQHPEAGGQDFIKKLFAEAVLYADRGLHAPVFTEGRPVVMMNVDAVAYRAQAQPIVHPYLDKYGVDSVIFVPMRVGGEVIGSFDIVRHRPDRWLSEDDVPFVQDLANRASMAIENAQLFNELQNSRAALEQRVQDLNQFAYIASHDLKAPLRTINGFIRLIEKRYGDVLAQTGDYFDFIKDAAKDMQALIDDLLVFSRASNRPLNLDTLDLNDVVDPVLRLMSSAIEDKGARITVGDLPTVFADARYLKQVFQNLIGNALKFSRQDAAPVITLSAEADGPRWHVHIADNGIGIESSAFERIFQIFQRLHTTEEYDGTGIGLTLSAKIMERHGGRISVTSEVGVGSTFTLTFFNAGTDGALAALG